MGLWSPCISDSRLVEAIPPSVRKLHVPAELLRPRAAAHAGVLLLLWW